MPGLPALIEAEGDRGRRANTVGVTIVSPHLREAVRAFCLAAFARLVPEADRNEIPFVVEDRDGLYEYRPLLRDHVEARAGPLAQLEDARIALAELRREPAAAVFARGAATEDGAAGRALFRAILLPLLVATAEACGGFDWEDRAFDRSYAGLEHALFGAERTYSAVAPLVGLSVRAPIELARGIRVRTTTPAELLSGRPDAREALPAGFGEEPERTCVLSFERELAAGTSTLPDAPGELADAVGALRLATGAPVAAGPLLFEQLDGHPLELRPVPGIAATEPDGEPTRLDVWRGKLAGDVLERIGASRHDPALGDALEHWQLALFESGPLQSERLREALMALLGGADGLWAAAMRAAVLIGDTGHDQAGLIEGLRTLARGDRPDMEIVDTTRRAIVEAVMHDDRAQLLVALDEAMLGLRPRPAGYYSVRASAA